MYMTWRRSLDGAWITRHADRNAYGEHDPKVRDDDTVRTLAARDARHAAAVLMIDGAAVAYYADGPGRLPRPSLIYTGGRPDRADRTRVLAAAPKYVHTHPVTGDLACYFDSRPDAVTFSQRRDCGIAVEVTNSQDERRGLWRVDLQPIYNVRDARTHKEQTA